MIDYLIDDWSYEEGKIQCYENTEKEVYVITKAFSKSGVLDTYNNFYYDRNKYISDILQELNSLLNTIGDAPMYIREIDNTNDYCEISIKVDYGYDNNFKLWFNDINHPKEFGIISRMMKALIKLNEYESDKSAIIAVSDDLYVKQDGSTIIFQHNN